MGSRRPAPVEQPPASPGRFVSTDTVSILTALSGPASSPLAPISTAIGTRTPSGRHRVQRRAFISYSRPTLAVLSPPIKVCAAPHLAIAADLDKDGVVELIVARNSEGRCRSQQRRSDGSYGELCALPCRPVWGRFLGLTAVEYDGDGRTDIALAGSQEWAFAQRVALGFCRFTPAAQGQRSTGMRRGGGAYPRLVHHQDRPGGTGGGVCA